uniref:G protein-coupled receptor n=1 Tax=Ascaris lumbricoides TaxID=6252 RepID=A0A0M3IK89_ASCLU
MQYSFINLFICLLSTSDLLAYSRANSRSTDAIFDVLLLHSRNMFQRRGTVVITQLRLQRQVGLKTKLLSVMAINVTAGIASVTALNPISFMPQHRNTNVFRNSTYSFAVLIASPLCFYPVEVLLFVLQIFPISRRIRGRRLKLIRSPPSKATNWYFSSFFMHLLLLQL